MLCCAPIVYDTDIDEDLFLPSISIANLAETLSGMSFAFSNAPEDSADNTPPALPPVNPYHILQVRRDATIPEIRDAYRKLALWHHPGRKMRNHSISREAVQRRVHIFTIIAACYETLSEHSTRTLYDLLERQDYCRTKGEVLVGGKPWSPSSAVSTITFFEDEGSLFADCTGTDAINQDVVEDDEAAATPALLTLTDSEDSADGEVPPADPGRDALLLLFKARRHKPFADPYDLFDQVFDSKVYPRPTEQMFQEEESADTPASPSSSRRSAGWTGTTKTLKDGTIVSTTCRILHDRKLTRTEVITSTETGQKHTLVTVAAEELEDSTEEEVEVLDAGCFAVRRRKSAGWYDACLGGCCGAQLLPS